MLNKSLIALALGTFAMGIAEFAIMGILSDVASAMDVSISRAGDFISAYAGGVAVGAPSLLILRKYRIRSVIIFLACIIALGNLLCALSQDYYTLLVARFISGLPHGAYFGTAAIAASRLVPEGKGAQAVAVMIAGMSVSNVIGVPTTTLLTNLISWRLTFVIASLFGVLAIIFVRRLVPEIPATPPHNMKSEFRFLRHLAPWLIYAGIFIGQLSAYCWMSYMEPILTEVTGFSMENMTWLMIIAGSGMVTGGLVAGKLADIYKPAFISGMATIILTFLMPLIYFCAPFKFVSVVFMFIAAACLFAIGGPMQYLIVKFAPGGEMLGGAGIQIAFNVSNALAAALGGFAIHAGWGIASPALIGIPFAIIASVIFMYLHHRYGEQGA